MRRRKFIAGLASAAEWPTVARAQQRGVPTIGFLHGVAPEAARESIRAFYQGFAEGGFAIATSRPSKAATQTSRSSF